MRVVKDEGAARCRDPAGNLRGELFHNAGSGKDMSDLTSWTAQWNEVVDQLPDDGYNAWVMTPMFKSNMSDLDFLWVGAWPDFSMMGSGLDGFFNGKEGSAVFAKFLEITTCEIHDLYSSTQVRENSGD